MKVKRWPNKSKSPKPVASVWFVRLEADNSWLMGQGGEWVAKGHLWCVSTTLPFLHSLGALVTKSFLLACNYSMRGSDSRTPPRHCCVFKPLSPCGDSPFDAVEFQSLQTILTIWLYKKRQSEMAFASYGTWLLSKPPLFAVQSTVAKTNLRGGKELFYNKGQSDC